MGRLLLLTPTELTIDPRARRAANAALRGGWDVYAPDWRGYGLTEWGRSDSYWFPDYIADLDCLLEEHPRLEQCLAVPM